MKQIEDALYEVSVRVWGFFKKEGITTLDELTNWYNNTDKYNTPKGMGLKTYSEIEAVLILNEKIEKPIPKPLGTKFRIRDMNINVTTTEVSLIKEALTDLQNELVGKGDKYNNIVGLLNKLSPSEPKLKKELLQKKYMFTFEGGGWNTVWAKTKRGAIAKALKEYKGKDGLTPRPTSFHVQTTEGERAALSLFY